MRNRQPSRQGLSYLDANSGRLVTEGPDVLKIKAEIESRWPGVLSAYFDVQTLEWVIVEKCADGVERLAMKTRKLDMRVVEKLNRIDQAKHAQSTEALHRKLEAEDRQTEKEKDHALSEAVGEGAERLFLALRKDGIIHAPKVYVSSGI